MPQQPQITPEQMRMLEFMVKNLADPQGPQGATGGTGNLQWPQVPGFTPPQGMQGVDMGKADPNTRLDILRMFPGMAPSSGSDYQNLFPGGDTSPEAQRKKLQQIK